MRLFGIKSLTAAVVISMFVAQPVLAEQSFEDYMKEQQSGFQQFKEERDKEFTDFLQQQWKEFKGEKPVQQIPKPKPVVMPEEKPKKVIDDKIKEGKPVETAPVPKFVTPEKPKPVIIPVEIKPIDKPVDIGTYAEFTFFGTAVKFKYDKNMRTTVGNKIDNKIIADFWKNLANTEYKPLLEQLDAYRDSLSLNDWGYLMLVDQVAEKISGTMNDNDKTIIGWFILLKAGYDAKIAYKDGQINLLLPSGVPLYGVTYFTLGEKRYYAVNPAGVSKKLGAVYTYKESYPGAVKMLDFRLVKYPVYTGGMAVKKLSFAYSGKTYDVNVNYNMHSKAFFEFYPQTDVRIYTTSVVPNWVGSTILAQLREVIKGKSEKEAVNMLLRFTQKAFEYKRDPEQFGREKFLFPEETIIYPYSDCEDRSIMFSYLVKSLTGLDVVLLDYPGHIATAVKFNEKVTGDNLKINGETYTICDPTYINADIGKEMPQFKNVTPKIVKY